MGVSPSTASHPSTQISTVNMISSITSDMSKRKEIVETPTLIPPKSLYHVIQSNSDAYIDEQHLVVSDAYNLPC